MLAQALHHFVVPQVAVLLGVRGERALWGALLLCYLLLSILFGLLFGRGFLGLLSAFLFDLCGLEFSLLLDPLLLLLGRQPCVELGPIFIDQLFLIFVWFFEEGLRHGFCAKQVAVFSN
jgi:hypothetical protein